MIALDHIVIASIDPKATAQAFAANMPAQVVQGGKHMSWGTWNWLCHFSNDCYIEWIGIFDEHLARNSDNPLIQRVAKALIIDKKEGIIQFAFRTDQMDSLSQTLEKLGQSVKGPVPGSRSLPDGSKLEWRMLFTEADSARPLPFFIEWGKKLPASESDLNSKSISSITVPESAREHYEQLLGRDSTLTNTKLEYGKDFSFKITN